MSDEVSRGKGNGKAAFGSQLPALRAEAALFGPAFLWSLGPCLDHGTILRLKGGNYRQTSQRSGIRGQRSEKERLKAGMAGLFGRRGA